MNKKELLKATKTSTSEVLETMFSLPVDFQCAWVGIDQAFGNQSICAARLAFEGPAAGFFRLLVPETLARRVSVDFPGIDAGELTSEDVAGTVKEMVNMLVGNTFSNYDQSQVFDLKNPVLETSVDPRDWHVPGYEVTSIDMDTPDSRMVLQLALKQ